MTTATLVPGARVMFGRTHGERTLGEVVRANRASVQVRQLEARGGRPAGTLWRVATSLVTPVGGSVAAAPVMPVPVPVSKRADAEILREIRSIYAGLSPENLHMDGEISRAAAARRGAALNRRLRACFTELGRKVSESEAYRG